jgi:myo-inositol-1(or 4)-monophosphatase
VNTPLNFATHLARQAGELLLDYFGRINLQTNLKADRTVVTEADLALDTYITRAIREEYPSDLILSEELHPDFSKEVLSPLERPVWIVDPLDGTTNFSLGLQFWGVLITRLVNGWPDVTAQFFPCINELYVAQRGQGAFLNDKPIQARPGDPANPGNRATFFVCCSRTFRRYNVSVPYKPRILGSAAYSFCCISRGIAILAFEATPKIWDIAGGWLLVTEAGGFIETLDSSQPFPLQTGIPYASHTFPTLAAPTKELLVKAHQQIQPKS